MNLQTQHFVDFVKITELINLSSMIIVSYQTLLLHVTGRFVLYLGDSQIIQGSWPLRVTVVHQWNHRSWLIVEK